MKRVTLTSLGIAVAGAAVLIPSAATAGAGSGTVEPTESCYDLVAPATGTHSKIGATKLISSVYEVSHTEPQHDALDRHPDAVSREHPYVLGFKHFARGGVARAELRLAAPACAAGSYALELYDLARRPVITDDVRVTGADAETADQGHTILLSALIDDSDALYTGAGGSCANARLVVRDAGGTIVDVEPNAGYITVCTGSGGAGSYTG